MSKRTAMTTKRNAGEGELFLFHGTFNDRRKALAKKADTPGSFVRPVYFRDAMRYAVLTAQPQQNPPPKTRWLKTAAELTSGGRRSRSHHPSLLPLGPKICKKCRSTKNLRLDHKNGDQSDIRRGNHQWLCNACNIAKGFRDRDAGRGVRQERTYFQDPPKVGTLVMVKTAKLRKKGVTGKKVKTLSKPPRPNPAKKNPAKKAAKKKPAKTAAKKTAKRAAKKTVRRRNASIVLSPAELSLIRKISHLSNQPVTVARARQLKAFRARWSALIAKKNPATLTSAQLAILRELNGLVNRPYSGAVARRIEALKKKLVATNAKKNPAAGKVSKAKELVKRFVGRASGKETAAHHPGLKPGTVLANMKARLDYLLIANPNLKQETRNGVRGGAIDWRGSERPEIASEPGGRQYVFLGGNQKLDAIPPLAESDGMLALGEVLQLGYTARKHVDDFRLQSYYHNLGEENGAHPHLCYDPKQKQLYLTGGDYRTEAEGMAN